MQYSNSDEFYYFKFYPVLNFFLAYSSILEYKKKIHIQKQIKFFDKPINKII